MLINVCIHCKAEKTSELFVKDKRRASCIKNICKKCSNERSLKWSKDNPEKKKQSHSKWRQKPENKQKERVSQKAYSKTEKGLEVQRIYKKKARKIDPQKVRNRELSKERENRTELTDRYVKFILRTKGFHSKHIDNKELIEVQRLIIKTNRLCKTSQS